jgi:PBP1b-binding outer membrane lipoprotein LpoB
MKKIAILFTAIILTGCQSVPVVPKWPDVPKEFLQPCPDLKTVEQDNEKLSAILESITDNYKQFYDCKSDKNDWIEWYKGQQKIWETLK